VTTARSRPALRPLHQLRHSAPTHLAEDNVQLPLLMAKSRHRSLPRIAFRCSFLTGLVV
jgi:hypothetical protein